MVSSICSYGVPKFGGGALGSQLSVVGSMPIELEEGGFSSYGGGASSSVMCVYHCGIMSRS